MHQSQAVVPQFMVQGGDIADDGSGGESIYGSKFDDENFTHLHNEEGRVGMANAGPNSNGSQFYITTVLCSHLDNRNVVFGQVIKGLNIIREMDDVPRQNDVPLVNCVIENCGELQQGPPWAIGENDCTGDVYPSWPHDWDLDATTETQKTHLVEKAISSIKDSGNYYFKRHNYVDSERKYKKALRYIDYFDHSASMKMVSLLNLAAVRLKKNFYQGALDLCNQALSIKSNDEKALYRRAQARMGLKDYDRALVDLKRAHALCPSDKFIQAELENAKKLKLNYLEKEKRLFSKMFQ